MIDGWLEEVHGGVSGMEIIERKTNLRRIGHELDENESFILRGHTKAEE
jgi:hypothetical protein